MDILPAIFIPVIRNYCVYITFIGDLIITIILGYTGLKFDQINEYLKKLSEDNKRRVNLTWKHSTLRSYKSRFPKASRNKCNKMWIVMHLHSELCKISRKMDSIFGTQMTLEMGCYFTYIATASKEFFRLTYNKNYINNSMLYTLSH
ncbi:uncharacterized protein LOC112459649 [Temnothorax curvispinosus]|uniref:Uncharacterized protein LOC112459649 n=1 Tax=Temnothorax curvispinosus TaxID=300111 RepID=A0A6J1QD24_9HYME|nr:uncharacterized protein LOC112459649 [Temnothorax curvispinosus]